MAISKASVAAQSASVGSLRPTAWKQQDTYKGSADDLAITLGWEGPADAEKYGIRVVDARAYLLKVLHEIHVSAHRSDCPAPTNDSVIEHLGLRDSEEIAALVKALDAARAREGVAGSGAAS